VLEDNTTRTGRNFDYCIQFLIIISLIAYSVETLPNLSQSMKLFLNYLEIFCVGIFTIEYLLRVIVSENPIRYMLSFYGVVDLLAILPFYLRLAVDLRVLRVFRVFRVFRALKLIRYNKALSRFHVAAGIVKEEIVLFFIVTLILIFLTACGIYSFENEAQPDVFSSVFESLWWSIVTLTTVGYGDVYPTTTGGKIFTFFVLIIGVGIVTIPAGLIGTALSKAREEE